MLSAYVTIILLLLLHISTPILDKTYFVTSWLPSSSYSLLLLILISKPFNSSDNHCHVRRRLCHVLRSWSRPFAVVVVVVVVMSSCKHCHHQITVEQLELLLRHKHCVLCHWGQQLGHNTTDIMYIWRCLFLYLWLFIIFGWLSFHVCSIGQRHQRRLRSFRRSTDSSDASPLAPIAGQLANR